MYSPLSGAGWTQRLLGPTQLRVFSSPSRIGPVMPSGVKCHLRCWNNNQKVLGLFDTYTSYIIAPDSLLTWGKVSPLFSFLLAFWDSYESEAIPVAIDH